MNTRKIFVALLAIALLSACNGRIPEINLPIELPGESASHEESIYAGDTGPAHWEGVCQTGENQSPIDIVNAQPGDLANIMIYYEDSDLHILNNGHTVQADFIAPGEKPDASRSYIEIIDENGDSQRYYLVQFHYHAPSEHTVNGKSFVAEIHLVHKTSDEKHAAVIGILLEEGTENLAYNPFLENLPGEKSETATQISGVTINPAALLPATQTTYRYSGSLTTPPCSEGISWNVMTTPVQISEHQRTILESVFNLPTNRPVQRINTPVPSLIEDTTP